MKTFSLQDILDAHWLFRRNFCNSFPGFKSLNLIGTRDERGRENVAIFNSVVHVGATPPLMGMVIRPLTVPRVTYHNILGTGHFTINQVNTRILDPAHQTSANYPTRDSEFAATGLTPHYEGEFPAPYVLESRIRMGLKFQEEHRIAANGTIFLVGAVQEVHVDESLIAEDGFIDLEQSGTVAGSGLDGYYKGERTKAPRLCPPRRAAERAGLTFVIFCHDPSHFFRVSAAVNLSMIKENGTVVLVGGLPGTGKTYFAKRFARALQARYVSTDQLRKELFVNRTYTTREKEQVYEAMLAELRKALSNNQDIVIDATFYREDLRERFVFAAETFHVDPVFIFTTANEETIKERLGRPREDSEADYEVYLKVKGLFQPMSRPHLMLQTDQYHVDALIEQALAFIRDRQPA
jgi:predicted kinase/flavin reductase (DIM6/NTAB) family NADH-FMN oxidoreductase RutF